MYTENVAIVYTGKAYYMDFCLWCHKPLDGKKYCNTKCHDDYWNYERTHAIRVPEYFRPPLQEMSTDLKVPIVEALSMLLTEAFRLRSRGKEPTNEQIHEVQQIPENQQQAAGQPLDDDVVWGVKKPVVDQGGTVIP